MKKNSNNSLIQFFMPVFLQLILLSCAFHITSSGPEGYKSQERIVRQGFTIVPTPQGEIKSIFFGYDRNGDYSSSSNRLIGRGIDLIEYKKMLDDNKWTLNPFLIICDDNFDGFADKIFLDTDFNSSLDINYKLKYGYLKMDYINFEQFRPFHYID
jgi:hypothetical protein